MFQLMGGGDKAGSGMDKIGAGWRAQHWRRRVPYVGAALHTP